MKPYQPNHALKPLTEPKLAFDTVSKILRKRRSKSSRLLAGSTIAGLTAIMMSTKAHGQSYLGDVENFGIVSGAGLTNSGPSVVNGDVALSPLDTITGFPPGTINGILYRHSDTGSKAGIAQQAKIDSRTLYNNLAGANFSAVTNLSGTNLGGLTLAPGIYKFDTSANIATGQTLTLATGGNANAVYVFQVGSALDAEVGSKVIATGAGANTPNIFWQVGSSATIKSNAEFLGSIVADQSVSFGTSATLLNGRAIALEGAVTLLSNQISIKSLDSAGLAALNGLLSPDELTVIFQMGFAGAEVQNLNIQRHLELVRKGSGVTTSRTEYNRIPNDSKSGLSDSQSGLAEETVTSYDPNLWNVWIEGTDSSATIDPSSNANGYSFDTQGVTVGADRRLNNHLVVGILGSYNALDASLFEGGSVEGDNYKTAIYATLFKGGFFLDALLGVGHNSYDTSRSSLAGFAKGSPDGWELNSLLNGGYDIQSGNWTITPMVSASYTRVTLDSFTETGSFTPLDFPTQSQESLRSNLGVKLAYTAMIMGMEVTPQVRLAWQHEFLDSTQSMDSRFASGTGSTFTVNGPQIDRDRAIVSAGVNVRITPAVSAYAYYDGQVGSSNSSYNNVTVGVNMAF